MRSIALLACSAALYVAAQPSNVDCSTAQLLCAQQPVAGNNTGANGVLPGFCPATTDLLWYTFTTNSQGGTVDVTLDAIDCPDVPGMDNELTAVVLSGDGNCTPSLFTAVSLCETDSEAVAFSTTVPLTPNTQYWLVVAGEQNGGATLPAQCGFNVQVSGPGMDIVGVDFTAGDDAEIAEGGSTQLQVTGGTTYNWTPTSGLSGNGLPDPIASPSSSTAYAVTTTLNGCQYIDTVIVNVVRLIDPPNTFSPNGDGINDIWDVPGIAEYPGSEVVIFDRWGQRVFKSNGYREPWDGTNDGRPVSEGTYYYYIKLNQLAGRSDPYTGFISVIR